MMSQGNHYAGRNRSGYRAAIHGRMDDRMGSLSNDYTLRKGAPATLVWPRYEGGPLIFRPLPAVDPDDPRRFLPCRYSLLEYDFTDWTRRYTAARGVGSGENRLTFIIEDPTRENYGIDENPYRVVWSRIWRAVKKEALPRMKGVNPEQWLACVDRRGGTLPKVPRPASIYLFLGIVLHNDKETYVGAGKAPLGLGKTDTAQVIQLSATAGEAIWKALSEVRDEYRGVETDDYAKALVYGDPVHPEHGLFITVMGRHAATPYSQPVGGYDLDAEAGRLPGREREGFGRYTVSLGRQVVIEGRTLPHLSPALPPKAVERILGRAVQFDDILYIPTTEELCLLCARAWKNDSYILEYGWGDHPQFFTAEVRKILTNARTLPSAAVLASSGNRTLEEPSDAEEDLGEVFSAGILPVAAKPREESPAGGQGLPADRSSLDAPEAVFSLFALGPEDGDAPDGGMVPEGGVFGEAAPCTEAKEIPSAARGERPDRQVP